MHLSKLKSMAIFLAIALSLVGFNAHAAKAYEEKKEYTRALLAYEEFLSLHPQSKLRLAATNKIEYIKREKGYMIDFYNSLSWDQKVIFTTLIDEEPEYVLPITGHKSPCFTCSGVKPNIFATLSGNFPLGW